MIPTRVPKYMRAVVLAALGLLAGARAHTQSVWQGEAAAQQRFRVEARGVTVKALLEVLGPACGLRLESRRDVAGLKAAVFASDCRAGELLDAVAALFGAGWRRVEDPQGARYVLDLEPATRTLVARKLEAWLAAQVRGMDTYVEVLRWPEERLAALPENDPVRQYLSQPVNRAGLTFYAALTAGERARLWSRRRLSLPFRSLPPVQQQTTLAIARYIADSAAARPPTAERTGASQELDLEALQRGSVQLRLRSLAGQRMLFLTVPNGGVPLAVASMSPSSDYRTSGNPYTARPTPLEAPADTNHGAEEALKVPDYLEAMHTLALKSGRPVLRDFHRFARTPPPADESLQRQSDTPLDRLAARQRLTWWQSGSALLFRSHDWFLLDPREPPDEVIAKVARIMPDPPERLPASAFQEYCRLTVEQITGVNRRMTSLADESLYDGLHELSALVAAIPGLDDRMSTTDGVNVPLGALPGGAQTAIQRFAEAVGELAPLSREDRLRLQAKVSPVPPRSVGDPAMARVSIQWGLGRSAGAFMFYMPTALEQPAQPAVLVERIP